jgi:cyclohexa-1,5-dienecarbonyl-CoA hydratase
MILSLSTTPFGFTELSLGVQPGCAPNTSQSIVATKLRKLFAHAPLSTSRVKRKPCASIDFGHKKTPGEAAFAHPHPTEAQIMIEPVAAADFTTQSARRHPSQFEFIKFRIDKSVARLTLNRPEHNLLNEAMLREIADGILFAGDAPEAKLVVLDSACKVFSGGIDIGEYTSQRVFQMLEAFHAAFAAMLETGKPVICVVNGPAIGGGAELAAFGDLVVATPKARFAQPEITIGVFPPLASTILPFLVGPKTALEIILTGEPISAERALELGMINRLVPEPQLEKTVEDLVTRISGQSAAVLSMAKKAILGSMGLSLREGLKQSMDIFLNQLYRLEDSQEGLRALVEKRKPNWKNR